MFVSLLSLFIVPSLALEVVSVVACHQERVIGLCSQREKGSFVSVQAPFPGRKISSLRGQPEAANLLRKSVENGIFLGSESGCQMTASLRPPFPGCPGPFFHPSPPGRKCGLARVDEELERLFGLSPSLQDEGGHLSMWSCPCQSIASLY